MFQPVRGIEERERRAYTQRHAAGLDLGAVYQGFLDHWPEVERELPFHSEQGPPGPSRRQLEREQQRQALQARRESGELESAEVGSRPRLKKEPAVASPAAPAGVAPTATAVEVTVSPMAALRPMPRLERPAGEAAVYPVPNHSAGASGFSSTWSVAQKATTPKEGVILSE